MEHLSPLATTHTPVGTANKTAVRLAVDLVAEYANVPVSQIFSINRCRLKSARARQLSMYLAHVVLGESLTAIGAAFGRDRTTVSYACRLIEDMRDDFDFDSAVTQLEARLQVASGHVHA